MKLYMAVQGEQLGRKLKKMMVKAAKTAARLEGKSGRLRVSLMVTDDDNIRKLNKEYRDKDKATDVLSFPSGEDGFLGDIAISLPRAREQAAEYGHTLEREAAFLMAHAMLHLFGYDHMDAEEERIMRGKQREIMKEMGLNIS